MRHALSSYSAIRAGMLALALLLLANPTQPATTADPAATQPTPFKPEELEQIVAPIALYPDTLLAQVFMASTYPLEIVQAARWSKAHPEVKGDAVAKEMEKQAWDASVKSLVAFPDVLKMMDEKIDWTQKLGDAFLAQQKEVMAAVQRLRVKAKDAGNLQSTKEQVVKTEAAPQGAPAPQIIVIESSSPEVIYVPTYNPTVVYGAWPYPAYPPYYYYPPGYAAGAAFFSFGVGVVVGGAIWGNCNWGGGDVDIDINRYNNFNRNEFNRNEINPNRNTNAGNRANNTGKWQHDTGHRQGVGYRDSATQQKYGRSASQQGLQGREEFRGRDGSANTGGQYRDLGGGGSSTRDASTRDAAGRDFSTAQSRDGTAQSRDGSRGDSPSRDASSRDASQSRRSSDAFSGVGNGASTRAHSSRGGASRGGGGRRR
jgi:hypothetical protein